MNMGAGEVTLSSSEGAYLNNLLDHKVSLTLKEGRLTMTINDVFSTYVPVSNDGGQLNIDQGIWLGGTEDLHTSYLSNAITPFRGCMTEVKFQSHQFDILTSTFKRCQDTKEACSNEFEAGDGETTSFSTPDSFISFSTWSGGSGSRRALEFLMKTTIEDALLVFHPGQDSDFIAVGVVKGYLKGLLDLGSGMEALKNMQVRLDDDQWHRVKIEISQDSFVLNVDSQSSSLSLDPSQKLDLVGSLYLGGIQAKRKEFFHGNGSLGRIYQEDLTDESFIGCLGEIKVNQKDRNLQDALVTKDIHVKCEGEDYDYSNYDGELTSTSPTISTPHVYIDFNQQQHCYPTENTTELFRNVTKLLDITPLQVPEGGEVFLDINNLNPTFDLSAANMQQSQITFTLESLPSYGLVDININRQHIQKFTLLDIVNKRIKYMHDGNERLADQIYLQVVAQSDFYLPECLKTPHNYVLPIEILPVKDTPQLDINEISIAENGRTHLNTSIMRLLDFDLNCDDLIITVTSEPPKDFGYLEDREKPGVSISEFACKDLEDGNIYFVHRGGSTGMMTLDVPFEGSSLFTTFKLSVIQPDLTMVTNSGLLLSQGSNASIDNHKLAALAHPRIGDIVYNITQPLVFGELQILTNDGVYKQVTTFHQSDLDQKRLRYVSTDSSDQENTVLEQIQFSAHLGRFSLWNNTFAVMIAPAQVKVSQLVPLEMEAGEEQTITDLQAEFIDKTPDPRTIKYILITPPTLGSLLLSDRELGEGDMFTQKDILDNAVSYRARVRRAVDTTDQFQFKVFAEDQHSPLYTFPINIIASADAPVLTNKKLVVLEGSEHGLNKNYLWLESSSSVNFLYRVTQEPKHGRLIRDSPPGVARFEGAIRVFSNEDIEFGRLVYKHDGSKTSSDEFHFLANEENAERTVSDVFRISIHPKNEHTPVRTVDKVFNVVRNSQRLLTTDVIQFKDNDSGFNDSQIVYAREGILSGNIVSTSQPSQPLFRFTQADLKDKKVLFIHHGADRERFSLQVSDGFHKTTAVLEIQAGEPYLRVVNNTIIVIDHGSTKTLTTALLSAESNMDIRHDSEITFQITSPPKDGRIIVSGIEASVFTEEDLKKGVVSYEHNYESLRSKDSFSFTVQANGLSEEGTFRIKIFKQGYLSEPKVVVNAVIISYEGEHTVISNDHLKVLFTDSVITILFCIKRATVNSLLC